MDRAFERSQLTHHLPKSSIDIDVHDTLTYDTMGWTRPARHADRCRYGDRTVYGGIMRFVKMEDVVQVWSPEKGNQM